MVLTQHSYNWHKCCLFLHETGIYAFCLDLSVVMWKASFYPKDVAMFQSHSWVTVETHFYTMSNTQYMEEKHLMEL